MQPVLSADQIRQADQYTIQTEPIASIDLMERASEAFVDRLVRTMMITGTTYVFCGTGNNGGDGLAVGRMLKKRGLPVEIFAIGDPDRGSADFLTNLQRLDVQVTWLADAGGVPSAGPDDLIIDAMFGTGLSRPVEGLVAAVIRRLNSLPARRVALDIASGLFADSLPGSGAVIFRPDVTISFQSPCWSFFQPSLADFVGRFYVVDIGLDLGIFDPGELDYFMTERRDFGFLSNPRQVHSHKGDYGRLVVVAGSRGKMGAAVMCTQAALRSGAGLVFAAVPGCGVDILQHQVREAMVIPADGDEQLEGLPIPEATDVIAVGPGIGLATATVSALDEVLANLKAGQKLVIDADGINILARHPDWLGRLPAGAILTPHPGEFKRLVGEWADDRDRTTKLRDFCVKHHLNVALKGAYTAVCNPDGIICFNPTGNPGMATAGSGDVLTGVIAGLLATGLDPEEALRVGVYVHGLAGDLAAEKTGERSLIAGDIIHYLPQAYEQLKY